MDVVAISYNASGFLPTDDAGRPGILQMSACGLRRRTEAAMITARLQPAVEVIGDATRPPPSARTILLGCGILAQLLYLAMLVFVPTQLDGYSSASQTVSELSAVGAPTRTLWVALGTIYTLLVVCFGVGIRLSAGRSRLLRAVGGLLIATAVLNLFWPPMHMRGTEPTLTDTLHIVFTAGWALLTVLAIVFAAMKFGKRFRLYSVATLALLIFFGVLTGLDGPRIAANLPTPWVGVWERISIGAYVVWVVVLAIVLLRAQATRPATVRTQPRGREVMIGRAARWNG